MFPAREQTCSLSSVPDNRAGAARRLLVWFVSCVSSSVKLRTCCGGFLQRPLNMSVGMVPRRQSADFPVALSVEQR